MKKNRNTPVTLYLGKLPEPQKSTLAQVRDLINEILPASSECISYGLPAFKYNGVVVGGFAAAKKHCSYYPFSGSTLQTLKQELVQYDQTKSALHFPLDQPLSRKTVKQLILTRFAEIHEGFITS